MTTYSDSLKLTLIGDGEQTNVWGATTNTNLGTLLEQAIVGVSGISSTAITMTGSADYTLTNLNGAVDQARNAVLIIEGSSSGGYSVILPAGQQKTYLVTNNLSSGSVDIKPSGGTAVTIPNGVTMSIYTDGTSTQAVNYVDVAGVATTVANLPGGLAGYIPYQSAANTTSYLVPGTAGYVLTTAGAGLPPYWNPSGTATLASNLAGGAAGQVAYQTGTNTTGFTATGSTGQFLSSNGTSPPTWTSTIPTTINGVVAGNGTSFGLATGAQIASTLGSTAVANATSATTATTATTANALNTSNNYSTSGSMTAASFTATGAGSTGDQKFTVSYSGYTSGVSPTSIQLGTNGVGALYLVPGTSWDGGSGIGFVLGVGLQLQISSTNTLYTGAGNCYKTGSGTAWIIASDARIKKNVTPYTKGLAELSQINIKNFEFNGLGNSIDGTKGIGVIADEVEQILPESVATNKVKLHKDDIDRVDLKHFDSTELVYLLVNAVKELKAEVDALKAAQ